MKTLLRLLALALLLGADYAPAALAQTVLPAKRWDRRFGGTYYDGLVSAIPTADGGYLLLGFSASPTGGDKSQPIIGTLGDFWVVKLDAAGTRQWDRTIGGLGEDMPERAIQTPDGSFVLVGSTSSGPGNDVSQPGRGFTDYWMVKLDATGTRLWDRRFGGSGTDQLADGIQTADGGFLLLGTSDSGAGDDKTQASQGGEDYWLVKTDATGTKQWDRRFGGAGSDGAACVRQTPDGGFLLGGTSSSTVSGDKTQPLTPGSLSPDALDFWVLKLDAAGTKQWDRTIGGTSDDGCELLALTADGGYLVAGSSFSGATGDFTQPPRGQVDCRIVKLSAQGVPQWNACFGTTATEYPTDLIATAEGGFLLLLSTNGGADGDKSQPSLGGSSDYWMVKLNAAGTKQWDQTLGGSGEDKPVSIQQLADGGFFVAGSSNSGISGDKSQASWGEEDYWVLRLGPAGPLSNTAPSWAAELSIYPNPAHETCTVKLPSSLSTSSCTISVLDILGRPLSKQAVTAAGRREVVLPLHGLAAGSYIVRVEAATGSVAHKKLTIR
ncbi:T9SS type A sorting domain-containing protein [Hymenobacter psychrotolerans]|uniref:Por secretion system C-terminal sorting domain-containing protein n=1 Tax=Hymenobacter psychrotolerans DSM 18569 TaxID=1121959 RepID=A0A1M7ETX3_9BACT|nr:T9SS type A sorting domain-containing protein [Hymenobacter psychrotolerans]SHL94929.1 Por secretion system C-terminal sorting domain-containing protein [Hymenobacter psychrotolerans DSM 18569]